jgi:hypothetical protein
MGWRAELVEGIELIERVELIEGIGGGGRGRCFFFFWLGQYFGRGVVT